AVFAGSRVVSASGLPSTTRPENITQLDITEGLFELGGEIDQECAADRQKPQFPGDSVSIASGPLKADSNQKPHQPEKPRNKAPKREATTTNKLTLERPKSLRGLE
ncbi:hypothetical protein, partial [Limimaricola cinnabarinus]|uniref:hypothetical protein n=1 Tax=Limimaricola cinnabarinus TaxID=1125964 RepID=UPI002FDF8EC4